MDGTKKREEPKKKRRFSPEQYDFLKTCSAKGDEGIKEWNKWVHEHETEEILLEGADLFQSYLKGVLLWGACLKEAKLGVANLEGANLSWAHIEGADLVGARLKGAHLLYTHLECSRLGAANLEKAKIMWAYLQGTEFYESNLRGAQIHRPSVSSETSFWLCEVDVHTDFRGTALSNTQVDVETKQLLEYNIRRMNWERWYEDHPKLKWVVKPFWLMSDYGLSTGRIIFTFFGLAFIFANIYYHWGAMDYYILRVDGQPGFVENLFVYGNGIEVQWWLVPLRTLYFSIVTMTTLGFGDMYANAQSVWGHILLSVQVILGYVLLGALVTRFAVLFTAGGPAGKFANEKGEKDETE